MDKALTKATNDYSKAGYPTDAEGMMIVEFDGTEHEVNAYIEKVKNIEQQIENIQTQIYKLCNIKNNGHKWIREREEGPYGETFFYCEYCDCGR